VPNNQGASEYVLNHPGGGEHDIQIATAIEKVGQGHREREPRRRAKRYQVITDKNRNPKTPYKLVRTQQRSINKEGQPISTNAKKT
jgi:hypothetical protein